MICMAINQMMAAVLTVATDAATFAHGDTDARPRPVPSASRMSDSAAVTNAPPVTAAQDTADDCASRPTGIATGVSM